MRDVNTFVVKVTLRERSVDEDETGCPSTGISESSLLRFCKIISDNHEQDGYCTK